MKSFILSSAIFFTMFSISSCGESKDDSSSGVYQCPMKCEGEKTYTEAGKCPECKMDLEKK